MIVYGPEGVGKTTFGAGLENPIFIDCDEGSHRVDVARFPKPENLSSVYQCLDVLEKETHPYKTLVIDTLDALEVLLWSHICDRDQKENIEAYGYGKGYVTASYEWKLLIESLNQLRKKKNMHIVLLGHATIKLFKDPAGMDHDKYELTLNKHAYPLFRFWSDILAFANYETVITEDKNTERLKVADTGRRMLHTQRERGFDAKSRYSLPKALPFNSSDFITLYTKAVNNSVTDLKEKIKLALVSLPDNKRAEVEPKVLETIATSGNSAMVLEKCLTRLLELGKGE
jgi:hypothetical protein